ncbi:hypothetical protein L7F22_013672 [Adiantum nelumboides]|nr:hypothetical protein [Adiantum nelumboides]
MRQLKFHEQKLLKKVNFLEWKRERGHREGLIMRRYHITGRDDYKNFPSSSFHSLRASLAHRGGPINRGGKKQFWCERKAAKRCIRKESNLGKERPSLTRLKAQQNHSSTDISAWLSPEADWMRECDESGTGEEVPTQSGLSNLSPSLVVPRRETQWLEADAKQEAQRLEVEAKQEAQKVAAEEMPIAMELEREALRDQCLQELQPLHAENGAENQSISAENQPQEVPIDAPQVGEQVDGHRQPVVVMQPAEQPAVFDDLQAENPPVMDHWIVHVEGKKNIVADALSRKPQLSAVSIPYYHELDDMKEQYVNDENFARVFEQYNNICGMVTKLVSMVRKLDSSDPFRIKMTEQLLEKLYSMGVIPSQKSLALCDKLSVSSFCRRRLAVVIVRLRLAENLQEATTFIEQGHVRVGPDTITDPAFLITRNMEDFVTWVDTSKIRRKVLQYNERLDDYDLLT